VKNLTTIHHLKHQFQIKDFVEKTIYQINKDVMGLADDDIVITDYDLENIFEIVTTKVESLLNELEKNSFLQQFIYKVDLNEKHWIYFMSFQNFTKLAEEVIIREAQKVYLRYVFSDNE